jgi:hypothetical protein
VAAIIDAVAEAIEGLGSVPEGQLYAVLCGTLTMGEFQTVLDVLRVRGQISSNGHMVTWVGS